MAEVRVRRCWRRPARIGSASAAELGDQLGERVVRRRCRGTRRSAPACGPRPAAAGSSSSLRRTLVLTVTSTAPIFGTASSSSSHSGRLVASTATLSPAPTPSAISPCATASTRSRRRPEAEPQIDADLGVVVDQRLLLAQRVGLPVEQFADRDVEQFGAGVVGFPDGTVVDDGHGGWQEGFRSFEIRADVRTRCQPELSSAKTTGQPCTSIVPVPSTKPNSSLRKWMPRRPKARLR